MVGRLSRQTPNPKKSGKMKTSDGEFFLSYLKALSNKQLLSLEGWQKDRRLDTSTQEDAIYRLGCIMREKHRRCLK